MGVVNRLADRGACGPLRAMYGPKARLGWQRWICEVVAPPREY